VAEVNRVIRFDAVEVKLPKAADPVVVYDKYPKDRHHGWKFIRFGPTAGSTSRSGRRATSARRTTLFEHHAPEAGRSQSMEVFARGVRNSVGFDWDPKTKELWFTDNGRDKLGDDVPPDELNHAPKAACTSDIRIAMGATSPIRNSAPSGPARSSRRPRRTSARTSASLGIRFYAGSMFPPPNIAAASSSPEHGSWNRSKKKSGYRVMQAKVERGKVVEHTVFAEGFLDAAADRPGAGPVDVLVMPMAPPRLRRFTPTPSTASATADASCPPEG
jgi:glucose/arabinose dehydrogenase